MTGLIICVLIVVGFVLIVAGAIGEMRRVAYERDRAIEDLETAWAEIHRLRDPITFHTHEGVPIEVRPRATEGQA